MAQFTQANRPFRIETDLGEDVLLLRRFTGEESVSGLFHFSVDLLSEDPTIDMDAILRKPVSLVVQLLDKEEFKQQYSKGAASPDDMALDFTVYVMKKREIYRHLSHAADRVARVSELLQDIIVKLV